MKYFPRPLPIVFLLAIVGCIVVVLSRWELANQNDAIKQAISVPHRIDSIILSEFLDVIANEKYLIAAEMLKEYPDLIKTPFSNRSMPLHYACSLGKLSIVKLLIQSGANINAYTKYIPEYTGAIYHPATPSYSPLLLAIKGGYFEIAKYLIHHGADVTFNNGEGRKALHYAVSYGNLELTNLILASGADVNGKRIRSFEYPNLNEAPVYVSFWTASLRPGENKETPLHLAAASANPEIIKALIDAGANVNATDYNGKTPLHKLVEKHTRPNMRDSYLTKDPIHQYTGKNYNRNLSDEYLYHSRLESMRILIEGGAIINAIDNFFHTPLAYAVDNCSPFIVEALKKNGAKYNTFNISFDGLELTDSKNSPIFIAKDPDTYSDWKIIHTNTEKKLVCKPKDNVKVYYYPGLTVNGHYGYSGTIIFYNSKKDIFILHGDCGINHVDYVYGPFKGNPSKKLSALNKDK